MIMYNGVLMQQQLMQPGASAGQPKIEHRFKWSELYPELYPPKQRLDKDQQQQQQQSQPQAHGRVGKQTRRFLSQMTKRDRHDLQRFQRSSVEQADMVCVSVARGNDVFVHESHAT